MTGHYHRTVSSRRDDCYVRGHRHITDIMNISWFDHGQVRRQDTDHGPQATHGPVTERPPSGQVRSGQGTDRMSRTDHSKVTDRSEEGHGPVEGGRQMEWGAYFTLSSGRRRQDTFTSEKQTTGKV